MSRLATPISLAKAVKKLIYRQSGNAVAPNLGTNAVYTCTSKGCSKDARISLLRVLKRKGAVRGGDRPFPVKKIDMNSTAIQYNSEKTYGSIRIPAGTKLAYKFPHLVKPG